MSSINRELLGRNIKYLADRKNIKIGEVETQAGVSVGYLSRIVKDNSGSNLPLLDVIMAFSEKLGVSMDSLLTVDFSKLSANEEYLSNFCYAILAKTKSRKIQWSMDKKDDDSSQHCTTLGDKTLCLELSYDENGHKTIRMSFCKDNQNVPICTVAESDNLYPIVNEILDYSELYTEKLQLNDEAKEFMNEIMQEDENQKKFIDILHDYYGELNRLEQKYGTSENLAKQLGGKLLTAEEYEERRKIISEMEEWCGEHISKLPEGKSLTEEQYEDYEIKKDKIRCYMEKLGNECCLLAEEKKCLDKSIAYGIVKSDDLKEIEQNLVKVEHEYQEKMDLLMKMRSAGKYFRIGVDFLTTFRRDDINEECADQIVKVEELYDKMLELYSNFAPTVKLQGKMGKATLKMNEIYRYTADVIADWKKYKREKDTK